jgi:hypothetical protein
VAGVGGGEGVALRNYSLSDPTLLEKSQTPSTVFSLKYETKDKFPR